ncbi:MAG TPA: CBS domain-containing protein [Spongiibacteraceae bacterium]|nr:CBS domain-containing protein [Spongiibacteraceae bacterium]HCS28723.1 CBS domain-containing protein [Spongiibacteraceae bacterium]|tara:strand:+ start:85 stop:507 length:423 start_codon:yes stop_codon:yes gene_type:complete
MQVKQIMSKKPEYLDASATIREAVMRMQEHNRGFTPIGEREKLVGVVTDRDIALRGVADGKTPDDPVSSVMSSNVLYCYQDDSVKDVLQNMHDQSVQRLAVLNNPDNKEFVGVVAISDIAEHCTDDDLARRIIHCCRHYH